MSTDPSRGCSGAGQSLRGRALLAAALLGYFGIVIWNVRVRGWKPAWDIVRVHQTLTPPFMDLVAVLQGLDRYRSGTPVAEIQDYAFGNEHALPVAYPSIWMWLFAPTGLGESQSVACGIALATVVTAATVLFLGPLNLAEAFFTALLLISPSFMLGIERGNADLIVFLVTLLGLWLLSKRFRGASACAASLIFFAALLKLYPIAALVSLLKKERRLGLVVIPAALFAIYCGLILPELRRIAALIHPDPQLANAGRGTGSFGCMVAFDRLFYRLHDHGSLISRSALELTGLATALVSAGIIAKVTSRLRAPRLAPDLPGLAFVAGAAIYAFCFLIGNNYDYRLRWLILCVPQAFAWIRQRGPGWRRAALSVAAALLTAFVTGKERFQNVAEPLNWLLFALLISLSIGALRSDIVCGLVESPFWFRRRLGLETLEKRKP
jgi:hypothetical protein